MNTLIRTILAIPATVLSYGISNWLINIVLKFILSVSSLLMFTGNRARYWYEPEFGFDKDIQDIKIFIMVTCLAIVVSGAISGFVCGFIVRKKLLSAIIAGVSVGTICIFLSLYSWDSDHIIFSVIYILALLISLWGAISVAIESSSKNE